MEWIMYTHGLPNDPLLVVFGRLSMILHVSDKSNHLLWADSRVAVDNVSTLLVSPLRRGLYLASHPC